MNIRTYCLVITFIFALLSPAFGEEAVTPPAEGEQGTAPLANEPPVAVTRPQEQGSSPAASEQDVSSPDTDQQATSPEDSPPAAGEQDTSSPATSQEEVSPLAQPKVTPGSEPPPAVTSPQGQGSPPIVGEQDVSPPATGQEEVSPLAQPKVTPGSEPPPAATSPQEQGSSTAAGEQDASSPATDQQAPNPEAAPPVVGAEGETPATAGSQGTYAAPDTQQESSSPAGEPGSASLTLQESIEIALQKSPTLQAAQSAIKEAKYRRKAAISDFLPQVSTQYSYTRLDREPYFYIPSITPSPIQIGSRDAYNWSNTVIQPIFTGGALINNYLLARLGVDTAKVEFERTRLDLILQVKVSYYAVLTAEKGVEVAEQTVAQLESNLEVAQAFFDVGMTAKNDLLQVEVSMAQARQFLITAQNALEVTRAVFNTLLRRGINEPVMLVEALEYIPMTIDMDRFIEEAYQVRPELKAAELGIKSAKRGVGLAASGLFPQMSMMFNYAREGDTPSVNGSRFQPHAESWYVTAVAEWNVWDWGKTWWGVGENKAKVFQAECALEEIKDGVRLEVQGSSLSVTEASKNIQVAETAVSQAEENFRINEERYKGQVATSTDVLDALTLLVQAKTNYYRALSDYNIAKARLQRAIGGR